MATTKANKTAKETVIEIKPINIERMAVELEGTTPLIQHRWSEKARKELLGAQMTETKSRKKDLRNPEADFVSTLYLLDGELEELTEDALMKYIQNGGRIGFPATAFKACAISGTYRAGADVKMTELKANLHIPTEFVEIRGDISSREDMVKIGGISKVSDIRFRAQISNWKASVPVEYNADMLSPQMIANMFMAGGFACGVGEWRPERGGNFGRFKVVDVKVNA